MGVRRPPQDPPSTTISVCTGHALLNQGHAPQPFDTIPVHSTLSIGSPLSVPDLSHVHVKVSRTSSSTLVFTPLL